MKNRTLISYLIRQDLRHHQLLNVVEKNGMDTELHFLDVMEVVGQLMGLPPKSISDQFVGIYLSFMEEACLLEVTGKGDNLEELSIRCYDTLLSCIDIERRVLGVE